MRPESENAMPCRNCGEIVTGTYCSNCGQKRSDLNVPLRQLLGEFLGDVFTLDSRFWRTFVPLITKPGWLTQKYNAGQRVRFVPPFRLYLFISVIFFFSLALQDVDLVKVQKSQKEQSNITENTAPNAGDDVIADSSQVKEARKQETSVLGEFRRTFFENLAKASDEVDLLNQTVVERLPQLMFFLVPVFALFLNLLFRTAGQFYIQHLVFGLHFHSFTFCILTVFLWTSRITNQPFIRVILLALPLYLWLALQRVYDESAAITVLKTLLLSALYLVTLLGALLIVVVIMVLSYG